MSADRSGHRPFARNGLVAVTVAAMACLTAGCDAPPPVATTPAAHATHAAPRPTPLPYTVCVQPLGEHDATLLPAVERGITQAYGFAVRRLEPRPLPAWAWYEPRSRHRADALLDHLLYDVLPAATGCHAVLGFTGVDVSTTKAEHVDWGVLGLAFLGGRVAVVSSYRLGGSADRARLATRTVKVALHELGHVIGVPHRGDGAGCLMNDAVGAVATIDRAEGAMCAPERAAAERFLGYALPPRERLDWRAILAAD